MNLEHDLAKAIIRKLRQHSVKIFMGDRGNICFFVPSPGSLGRPAADDYERGLVDGAILELKNLIRSLPALKRAVLHELSAADSPRGSQQDR